MFAIMFISNVIVNGYSSCKEFDLTKLLFFQREHLPNVAEDAGRYGIIACRGPIAVTYKLAINNFLNK